MGSMFSKKPKKSRHDVSDVPESDTSKDTGLTDIIPSNAKSQRFIMILSVVSILLVLVFFLLFFFSDTTTKLIMKRYDSLKQSQTDSEALLEIDEVPGMRVEVNPSEVIEYLDTMSDADYRAFIDYLLKISRSQVLTKGIEDAGITLNPPPVLSPEEEEAKKQQDLLEAAEKEAAERFPGRVKGSQRLKLHDEMVAKNYYYYVLEKGDSLYAISEKFDVPIGVLVEVNGITNPNVLETGRLIFIPMYEDQTDGD